MNTIYSIQCRQITQIYGGGYQITPSEPEENSEMDEIIFSDTAVSFSQVLASSKAKAKTRTPEEMDRIAEITDMVRTGVYEVSGLEIANAIMDQVLGTSEE